MYFLFLSQEERLHPFMQKGGTLTQKELYPLWEDLRTLPDAQAIIFHCQELFRERAIVNILLGYSAFFAKGLPADEHLLVYNYDDFIDPFIGKGHYNEDLTVRAAALRIPFFICDSLEVVESPDRFDLPAREAEEFALSFGIRYCLCFSLRTPLGGFAATGLVARDTHGAKSFFKNIERYGRDWWVLSCLMNAVIHENTLLRLEAEKKLKPNLQEFLCLHADTYNVAKVAQLKNIPKKTMESYFKDIRSDTNSTHIYETHMKFIEFGFYKDKK